MDKWDGRPRYLPGVDPADVKRRKALHLLRLKAALLKVTPKPSVVTVQYRSTYDLRSV
jgi:hypothetical protein